MDELFDKLNTVFADGWRWEIGQKNPSLENLSGFECRATKGFWYMGHDSRQRHIVLVDYATSVKDAAEKILDMIANEEKRQNDK